MRTISALPLLAILFTLPSDLGAQSCAAADSVVGAQVRRGGIDRRYERVTDTTTLEVREEVVRLISSSPDASFRMISAFEGESPRATPVTNLHIVVAVDRHGSLTDQQMTAEQARLRAAESVGVLLDNSTRLRLPRSGYTAAVQQANLLRGTRLLEDAAYTVTLDQLRQIATARRVEMVAGPVRGGFSGGRLNALKELYRIGVCAPSAEAPAAAADASPTP